MKKLFTVAAVAAMALGITSCTKVGPGVDNDKSGDMANVSLVINTNTDNTRGEGDLQNGTEAESKVNMIEIYVYNSLGTVLDTQVNATGTQGYLKYDAPTVSAMLAGVHDGRFVATTPITAGTAQVLVAINANLGTPANIATELGLASGVTPSMYQIMGLVRGTAMTTANTRTIPAGGFVMSGFNLAAEILTERSNRIEVPVYRSVSKIEGPTEGATKKVEFSQLQFDKVFQPGVATNDPNYITITPEILGQITFNINGYAVVSGLVKSTTDFVGVTKANLSKGFPPQYQPDAFTYNNEWTEWAANGPSGHWTLADQYTGNGGIQTNLNAAAGEMLRGGRIQSNSYAMKLAGKTIADLAEWTSVYSGLSGTSYIIPTSEAVYIHESKPGTMTSGGATPHIGFNSDQIIAYIVRGNITYNGVTKTRYWRVNVRSNDAFHAVRNSVYKLTVSTLVTGGFETPWEAEEETPIVDWPGKTSGEFVISVSPWEVMLVGNEQL